MVRLPRSVLLLSLCPICFDESGALSDAVRAGAVTLALVLALVLAAFVRFACRLRESRTADRLAFPSVYRLPADLADQRRTTDDGRPTTGDAR